MDIAIALNNKVVFQAYVLLRSLVKNNEGPCRIFVLHNELTEDSCRLLREAAATDGGKNAVEFIRVGSEVTEGLPYNRFWSVEMYYRLLLPQMLGDELERILYLDVDMIVNKDITDFYNTDFEGKLLVVSKDPEFENILANSPDSSEQRREIFNGFKARGEYYFCSGMLLMNLRALKERYSFDRYMEIFGTIKEWAILPDQDLLNYAHHDEVKYVDENVYGLFTQTAHQRGMTYGEAKESAAILHFTGQAKPWTVNLVRYDIERIWWEYAKDSPFYHDLMEEVFFKMLESTLAERKFDELMKANGELEAIIAKYQELAQKLMNTQ